MGLPVDVILVPQGAEYNAVCRGLAKLSVIPPQVIAIPIGIEPVTRLLKSLLPELLKEFAPLRVLVMGLCGSLVPHLQLGDAVLYQSCAIQTENDCYQAYLCDRPFTELLQTTLGDSAQPVQAITCDRVICAAIEKRMLATAYSVDVVDMEGVAVLDLLGQQGVTVAMLRVVSDNCYQELPDLATAIDAEGRLQPGKMAIAMLRQPIAATRLICSSLRGLQALQSTTRALFAIS